MFFVFLWSKIPANDTFLKFGLVNSLFLKKLTLKFLDKFSYYRKINKEIDKENTNLP